MSESSVNLPSSPTHSEQGTQISLAVEQVTRGFQAELGHLAERVVAATKGDFADGLVRALARLDSQPSQGDLLNVLLSEARQFASRTAFFLTRPEGVRCWSSDGFALEVTQALNGVQISYGSDQAWASLAEGKGVVLLSAESCQALTGQVDAEAAAAGVLVPFVLRGQLGGALYADQTEAGPGLIVGALQVLAHTAAQALETLPVRSGAGSPSLRFADTEAQAIPLWSGQASDASPEPESPNAGAEASAEESPTLSGAAVAGLGAVAGAVAAGAGLVAGALGADQVEEPEPVVASEEVASEAVEAEPEPAYSSSSPSDTVDLLETPDFDTAATPIYASPTEAADDLPEVAATPNATEPALPDLTAPDLSPADAVSGFTVPDVTAPDAAVPDVAVPDVAVPDVAVPDVAVPDVAGSEPILSEPVAAEAALPDVAESEVLASEYLPAESEAAEEDLDDTASSLWDLEEDDEDATAVTAAVPVPEPEPIPEVPSLEAPALDEPPPVVTAPEALLEPALPAAQSSPESPASFAATPESLVGQQTVRLDVAALQQARGAQQVSDPGSTLDTQQAEAAAAWQSPPEPADVPAVGDSEDPTLMVSRDQLLPTPPTPESAPPSPPLGVGFGAQPSTQVSPPPAKPASTSSEVVPPEDVQGPGSAFGSSSHVPEGEQALHEEARRLARLLVSEIKLYNEDQIALGRRDSNIYERLKDDIDRSRQMYEERIHERIRNSEDYFYHELVQRLADGNASLLGI